MIYKTLGKTGIQVSALGFGAMRLPMIERGNGKIVDEDKAIPLIHRALDLGINYVDTAPGYCDRQSEAVVGKAIKGRRDSIYLSTKNPIEDASGDNWRRRLENSLTQLDTDYIDFYHMWGINLHTFENKVDVPGGPMEAAWRAKDEGLIRHISFSFHDEPGNIFKIIDSGYFETVLLQYNLLDQSLTAGMEHAYNKGMGVVVMGPVGGGRLGAPSEAIRSMLGHVRSTAEMALRFVIANPYATVALSGMSDLTMLEENAAVASIPGGLTEEERIRVADMLEENKRLADLYCTGCNYCMPCPVDVNIPRVFQLMNYSRVYGLHDYAKQEYRKLADGDIKNGRNADVCVECGSCEEKCPQDIHIIHQLRETSAALGVAAG
ncbi:aldo/keto reductase [Gorillibacterium massiliense]|uniref:aldo/keto reductase n=1 Tax=Gorillibacterium massiliense TaxID=1280390 RepID=UPI0004B4B28D|nr:aldo/keto reductase [Gorillibacterium massiliense]